MIWLPPDLPPELTAPAELEQLEQVKRRRRGSGRAPERPRPIGPALLLGTVVLLPDDTGTERPCRIDYIDPTGQPWCTWVRP